MRISGSDPVGVLIGAKRSSGTRVMGVYSMMFMGMAPMGSVMAAPIGAPATVAFVRDRSPSMRLVVLFLAAAARMLYFARVSDGRTSV